MTRRIEYAFLFAVLALALAAFCVFSRVALLMVPAMRTPLMNPQIIRLPAIRGLATKAPVKRAPATKAPATRALATKAKRWGFRKVRKLRSRLVLSLAVPRFETQCV